MGDDTDDKYQAYFAPQDAIEFRNVAGNMIRGWFVNRGADAPLVVMFGGNAMNVGAFGDLVKADKSRSYLLLNYRGYGRSEGSPSQDAIVGDTIMSIYWLEFHRDIRPSKLILVGYSIGSGVAMQVAGKTSPDAVILLCPFDSIEAVARQTFGRLGAFMVRNDAFRSIDIAPKLQCPVSIFLAEDDEVIPMERTQTLIAGFAQTKPQVYWMSAGHCDIMSSPHFMEFFEQSLKAAE